MKRYMELVAEALETVDELFPWDLEEAQSADDELLLLDVREPYEFQNFHIPGSLNVPRGVLEQSCESGFEETNDELVGAREDRKIIVICRSGYRSALAARVMQILGFQQVLSLKTGVKGWNDYDLPLTNVAGESVSAEDADAFLATKPPLQQ